ncbi:hypothetical protein [Halosimplex amylolyticum]|uniref:hypothetical protein n=1 Tax=Halosimplex amylolyticum TaxID=3396616 RepID=UPI003F562ACB
MDHEELREKLDESYRIGCPFGHSARIPSEERETAYCRSCNKSHPFEDLIDKAERPISHGSLRL